MLDLIVEFVLRIPDVIPELQTQGRIYRCGEFDHIF